MTEEELGNERRRLQNRIDRFNHKSRFIESELWKQAPGLIQRISKRVTAGRVNEALGRELRERQHSLHRDDRYDWWRKLLWDWRAELGRGQAEFASQHAMALLPLMPKIRDMKVQRLKASALELVRDAGPVLGIDNEAAFTELLWMSHELCKIWLGLHSKFRYCESLQTYANAHRQGLGIFTAADASRSKALYKVALDIGTQQRVEPPGFVPWAIVRNISLRHLVLLDCDSRHSDPDIHEYKLALRKQLEEKSGTPIVRLASEIAVARHEIATADIASAGRAASLTSAKRKLESAENARAPLFFITPWSEMLFAQAWMELFDELHDFHRAEARLEELTDLAARYGSRHYLKVCDDFIQKRQGRHQSRRGGVPPAGTRFEPAVSCFYQEDQVRAAFRE